MHVLVAVQAIADDSLTAYSVWNRDTRAEVAARSSLRVAAYEAAHPCPAVEAPEEAVVQRMQLGPVGSEEATGFELHCLAQEPRLGRVYLRYLTDAPAATCDAGALAGDVAAGAHDLTEALVAATHASGREAVLPVLDKGAVFVRGVGQVCMPHRVAVVAVVVVKMLIVGRTPRMQAKKCVCSTVWAYMRLEQCAVKCALYVLYLLLCMCMGQASVRVPALAVEVASVPVVFRLAQVRAQHLWSSRSLYGRTHDYRVL